MATYLDVSRTSVSNWINGRVDPSTQTLRLWALRCGVPYEWLARGEHSPTPSPDGNGIIPGKGGDERSAGEYGPLVSPIPLRLARAA